MTDVAHMYDKAPINLVKGNWAWKSGVTTLYMSLHTSSLSPDQTNDETWVNTNEISGGNYVTGGAQITPNDPVNVGTDPSRYTKLYSSDVTWSSATFTGVRTAIIYNNTGSKYVIGFITWGADKAAQGGSFTVTCPTTGWFDLATP